ncbi:hypothetical protein [Eubacterium limosum]|uniref:hypothetical protein n=1 Tax=Eubacterium limosum TaxID=1736 RepID=UPI00371F3168
MPVQIDMEMPRSCLDCRFCTNYRQMDCARCHAVGDYGGREIPERSTSELYAGRQDWCPLVETEDRTWHVVADGDLPLKPESGMKKYFVTKLRAPDFRRKKVTELYWDGNGFYHELFTGDIPNILAWRELLEPWEGEK